LLICINLSIYLRQLKLFNLKSIICNLKKIGFLLIIIVWPFFIYADKTSVVDSLLNQIEKSSSLHEKVNLYNSLAKVYWYNRPSKTIEYGKKALEISKEIENDTLIINSRINIGIGYLYIADYENAMSQFVQSLSLSEKINHKSGISNSLSNIAIIYDHIGNNVKAEAFYLKSIKINKEIKDDKGIIGGLNNLGILYVKSNQLKKALDCYEEALIKEKAINEKQMIAITLSNIGGVYEAYGDQKKALDYYQNSLKTGQELKNNTLIIASMINVGRIHVLNKNYTLALEYYNNSLELSQKFGFVSFTNDIYKYLSELYEKLNNSQKALDYFKKYDSLKSTLLSKETNNKITELQVRYETEEKEIENEILLKENKYQRGLRNFSLILTAFVIVIAFLFFRGYRIKLKTAELLVEKNQIITQQNDQLEISMTKLQQSEEMYRSLVTTSPDGIVIANLKARITYVSPGLLKIYGHNDSRSIIGKNTLTFISREDWAKAADYFQDLVYGKSRKALELKGIKNDGSVVEIEINGGVLKDMQGFTSQLFFMFRDITQRKQIEAENRKQQELLFEQSKEISKLELLKKEQENYHLKLDIEFKDKDLASKAMYLIQSNELIEDVVKKLKDIEKRIEENEKIKQSDIRSLINDLKNSSRNDSWKEFDAHFTQVHQGFYDNLMARFPDLSPNEKKLCAFLRLNLSTKEISDITKKSVHSLNVARTRLRQKLGIANTEDNLSSFLSQF
jgi:PAS domain S-box-containing protein